MVVTELYSHRNFVFPDVNTQNKHDKVEEQKEYLCFKHGEIKNKGEIRNSVQLQKPETDLTSPSFPCKT